MDKRFWGILVGIVIIFGVIFWFTGKHKAGAPSGALASSHIEGSGSSGVTLIEYGDYECPFCGEYYPVVKQVQAEYSSQIFFQFRNLPLVSLHPNAFAGARAAEAAALQGKFWEMHDALYQAQDPNGKTGWVASSDPLDQYFANFASQLGLNVAKFKTDFAGDQVNNTINADLAAFAKTKAQEATPTFFLDGKQISPGVFNNDGSINAPATINNFQNSINAEITKKTGKPATTPATQ